MKLLGFEQRWADVIGRVLVPRGALGGVMDALDAGALFAEDCASSPAMAALSIRLALWAVWFAPLFKRGRTFGGLSPVKREETLEAMLVSRVQLMRMLAQLVKLVMVSQLLGDLRALKSMGAYGLRA
jgi:hypothetical protein